MSICCGLGRVRLVAAAVGSAAMLMAVPASARAQVYFASYTGTNFTRPSTVRIDQPAFNRTLDFADVEFEGQPLKSPQYYGARLGWWSKGALGVELEFLHQKAVARTERDVHVTGQVAGIPVDTTIPMNEIVQRYAMTHGLNFWLANLVWRTRVGGDPTRVSLVARAGVGPVTPGTDTVVGNRSVQRYQYAGPGTAASAGLEVRVWRQISITAEYKFSFAKPRISVDGGHGRATMLAHHVAAGFVITRPH